MVVRLTLVIIVMMAMIMTIIATAADYSCRWGIQGGGSVCMCVSMQTPECLGNPQRKVPSHRTSLLQRLLPAAGPLISGNKRGRAFSSFKIAVGGVEGCTRSDSVSHIACISICKSQLKKCYKQEAKKVMENCRSEEGFTVGDCFVRLITCLWCSIVCLHLSLCVCGCVWLPQLLIMKWQPDKLWL